MTQVAKVTPMLASAATDIPTGEQWCIEWKIDGWRATYDDDGLHTRTGKGIPGVPYITQALKNLPDGTVIDGEIVDLRADAGREWNRTQSILSRTKPHEPTETDPPLTYVVFDVLYVAGKPAMHEPLRARQQLLPLVVELAKSPNVVQIDSRTPPTDAIYEEIVAQGFEGVVCKDLDAPYIPGARNGYWLKIKPELEMDVEVTGTYAPEAGSKYDGNAVGGIEFLARHADGSTYAGRAAGMNDELRTRLHVEPEAFVGKVAVVAYAALGDQGALRFPRFKRFRDEADKAVIDLPQNASSAKMLLLERAIGAERERDAFKAEAAGLRERLTAILDGGADPYPIDKGHADMPAEEMLRVAPTTEARLIPAHAIPSRPGLRMRNYKAMKPPKLRECLDSLTNMRGDAWLRAKAEESAGGYTASEHLRKAQDAAREKGVTIP